MPPLETASATVAPARWKVLLPGPVSGALAIAVALFVAATIAQAVNLSWQKESFGRVEQHERGAAQHIRTQGKHR
jgi:hypothetical protein